MTPQQFKQIRQELGETQRELAKNLGLSAKNGDRTIRKIESGKNNCSGLLMRCLEFYYVLKLNNLIKKRK